jgi:hypothetical protein
MSGSNEIVAISATAGAPAGAIVAATAGLTM